MDRFLPPFEPRQVLDPADPKSIGAMVGPEAFTEVRYIAHHKQMQALKVIPQIAEQFRGIFGRDSGGLIFTYRADDADTLIVTLGSVIGTISEVIDEMRDQGQKIGAVTIRSFRPFPLDEIHEVLKNTRRVVVFEKCLAVGLGGIVASNVRMAHRGQTSPVYTVIGGLGGRPITRASLHELFEKAMTDDLEETTFLDLKQDVVDQEMERESKFSRSGAIAENILRDVGVVDVAKTT